jgi:endonuclease V-like protein UPF0215 family
MRQQERVLGADVDPVQRMQQQERVLGAVMYAERAGARSSAAVDEGCK